MRAFKAAAQVLGEHGLWVVYPVAIGLIATIAAKPANATDPTCLTKAEARQKFPKAHLYWHTQHRCWDATPTSRANRAHYKRGLTVGQAIEAPRPRYQVVIPRISVPATGSFSPWDERVQGAFAPANHGEEDARPRQ
jgi:hypothetical protein